MEIQLSCSKHFGEQLREIREKLNISQTDLAREARKSESTISKFEKNEKRWKVGRHNTYLYYCRALGVISGQDDVKIILTDVMQTP